MQPTAFLARLDLATRQLLATVELEFNSLELALLNRQSAPGAWSILECLEHLNRYSRYYNPVLAKALTPTSTRSETEVGYSWLGRKFIAMMEPGNTQKGKALKRMNPSGSSLGREVLVEFQQHQQQLLELLEQAQHTNLNRKSIPVEFLKILKMRVGEALEFLVVHEQRHVQQALNVRAGVIATPHVEQETHEVLPTP